MRMLPPPREILNVGKIYKYGSRNLEIGQASGMVDTLIGLVAVAIKACPISLGIFQAQFCTDLSKAAR